MAVRRRGGRTPDTAEALGRWPVISRVGIQSQRKDFAFAVSAGQSPALIDSSSRVALLLQGHPRGHNDLLPVSCTRMMFKKYPSTVNIQVAYASLPVEDQNHRNTPNGSCGGACALFVASSGGVCEENVGVRRALLP